MTYDGSGLVEAGTGWYLVVLGHYGTVLVGTYWYLVSIGWYWLIYDGTGSVGCYHSGTTNERTTNMER